MSVTDTIEPVPVASLDFKRTRESNRHSHYKDFLAAAVAAGPDMAIRIPQPDRGDKGVWTDKEWRPRVQSAVAYWKRRDPVFADVRVRQDNNGVVYLVLHTPSAP